MREKLGELATDLTPLTESWTGEAAEAYQRHMREWRAAAKDPTDVLGRIAGMVRTAESNYRNTVSTNGGGTFAVRPDDVNADRGTRSASRVVACCAD